MWRVAARFPKYIENIPGFGAIVGLEEQINWMRIRKMEAEPYAYESDEMLAIATYVAFQSRLLPVEVDTRGVSQWFYKHGRELYEEQRGKLGLSCADCHEDQKGNAWLEDRLTEENVTARSAASPAPGGRRFNAGAAEGSSIFGTSSGANRDKTPKAMENASP